MDGAELTFGGRGDDAPHLIAGWSGPEPEFRWMQGDSTSFWIDAPPGDFVLELDCTPVQPKEPPRLVAQRLYVDVDGVPVGHVALDRRRVVAFRVRRAGAAGRVTVMLHHPDDIHPSETGHSPDSRVLGIRIAHARTLPAPAPTARPAVSLRPLPRYGDLDAGVKALTGLSAADLANQFESLGRDCEFGLFQRQRGIEPIGLLRFAEIHLESLISGLHAGFADIGNPAFVRPQLHGEANKREYLIHHDKYFFRYHSFVYKDEQTPEELRDRHSKLLPQFRRMTLERIANAEKLFVYKRPDPLSDAEALALFTALRRLGPAVLLYVVLSDADHPSGMVTTTPYDGLLKGYIDHFWRNTEVISARHWLEVCANAHLVAAGAQVAAGPAPVPAAADAALRALAMRFESLGGTGHGCEFGIFQRDLGAEPLALLRWADISHNCLADALETDFYGVGDPEFTVVFDVGEGNNGEWWTRDTRHHMAMRSFVKIADTPYEKMVEIALKRLRYLREKLIADLREGEKIFVYRMLWRNLTEPELARLHRAVRRYGPNTLLVLQYADEQHPNGSVEWAGEGLLLGHVTRFGFSRENVDLGSANELLLPVCRKAVALVDGQRRAAAASA